MHVEATLWLPGCPAARAQRQSQAVQSEQGAILDEMARLTVECTAVGRALKQAGKEREERLLCVDMGRLELRRLRTLLGR
jgi:DNA anti-recombination protein RmuC